jgi:Ran GTPase-activating protein (RanGAP) involved in mRNA processing and transport
LHVRRNEQATNTAAGKCIANGLARLSAFGKIRAAEFKSRSVALHMPKSLCKALINCQELSRLCLAFANMRHPATDYLGMVVIACTKLQHLDISGTFLGNQLMKTLQAPLLARTSLRSLDLAMCDLGEDSSRSLAAVLQGLQSSLTRLNLDHNNVRTCTLVVDCTPCYSADLWYNGGQLGSGSVKVLAEGLGQCRLLRVLRMKRNKIEGSGAARMATALAACEHLRTLDLGYNELGDEGAERLAAALIYCTLLHSLSLDHICMGRRGVRALAGVPAHCGALVHLDLSGNAAQLNDGGGQVDPVPASGQSARLTHLDLGCSKWVFPTLQLVLWKHACTLQCLGLKNASLGLLEAQALAIALESCGALQDLDLSGNVELDDEAARALAGGLPHCTALRVLNLMRCKLCLAECSALALALPQCTALTELNFSSNKIGPSGATALAQVLPRCTLLTDLNVSYNEIRNRGATALAEVLGTCTALAHLRLQRCGILAPGYEQLRGAAHARHDLSLHFCNRMRSAITLYASKHGF